jgi:hypothetical protein
VKQVRSVCSLGDQTRSEQHVMHRGFAFHNEFCCPSLTNQDNIRDDNITESNVVHCNIETCDACDMQAKKSCR